MILQRMGRIFPLLRKHLLTIAKTGFAVLAITAWYNYFIYDTKGKRYEYNEELSGLPNIFVNEETQTLNLHTNDGHAGLMYTSSDYKWINGKLTLMRRDNQDYDPDRDIYILTSGVLNNNGVWEEKKQQFTEAQLTEEF